MLGCHRNAGVRIYVRTQSMTLEQRFIRVYAKRGERWYAVAVQVVPIPGRTPAPPPAPQPPGSTD